MEREQRSDRRPEKAGQTRARAGRTALGLAAGLPLVAAAGWIAYSNARIPRDVPLPPALEAERKTVDWSAGRFSYYVAGEGPPLVLIHSINAAGSAYDVRPLFEHYRHSRRVYAPDLPGFGFSERAPRPYTARLYTDALLTLLDHIAHEDGAQQVDALALSLSSEFLARAAFERPQRLKTIALVTPTGFGKTEHFYGPLGSTRDNPTLYRLLRVPLWRRPLFDLLASRPSLSYFLGQVFGSRDAVDRGLEAYDYLTSHQPNAEYATYSFISGQSFSADIDRIYESLGLPVWLCYGARNWISDFSGVDPVRGRPNWRIQRFEAGGLPHFDRREAFIAAYDDFLQQSATDNAA